MKVIPYKNKPRPQGTNTTYRELTKEDQRFVKEQCKTIIDVDDVCKHSSDPELQKVHKTLNAPNNKMPRRSPAYGGGKNSARSMAEGIIDNFNKGQYNISHIQMPGLEEAFRVASGILNSVEEVEFEEVTSLPKPKPVYTPDTSDTTFEDLFEITITVRKK